MMFSKQQSKTLQTGHRNGELTATSGYSFQQTKIYFLTFRPDLRVDPTRELHLWVTYNYR